MTSEKDDLGNFFKEYQTQYLIVFDILQEYVKHNSHNILQILLSHPFWMSQKFKTQGCQWYGVKQNKYIYMDKEESGTGFGALLYYLKYFSCLIVSRLESAACLTMIHD